MAALERTQQVVTCKDVIELLLEYLESTLPDDVTADIERHFDRCPACVAYLNTYKKTRELAGHVARVPMPEDMKARLRQFLLEHLSKHAS